MDLSKLSKGDRIVLITGLLLVIDLLFLPWYSITIANLVTVTRTGVGAPDAFLGFLGMLIALVMVPQIRLAGFPARKPPRPACAVAKGPHARRRSGPDPPAAEARPAHQLPGLRCLPRHPAGHRHDLRRGHRQQRGDEGRQHRLIPAGAG